MRHTSERVPGKNTRSFAGKPLFHHILESLSSCRHIHQIVVDTDSPVIRQGCARSFPMVRVIDRPESLRHPNTPMNDVLLNTVRHVDADYYLQTHATNPLLTPQTITRCIEAFLSNVPGCDSLFTVTRLQTRLWDELGRAINHNPFFLLRTQDLPPVYEENSCVYLFSRDVLEDRRNRIGARPRMYEIDRAEALDIDEELDFRLAEMLFMDRADQARSEAVA
jgi:CMP-N-acetylneuraminic acid synthetase